VLLLFRRFFINDPHLTIHTKAGLGFSVSYKAELISEKKLNYTFGVDLVHQEFTFNGYYAAPGYTYVFNKTFPYTHNVQLQELQIPIGFKESLASENSYDYTPYITGGMAIRFLLQTYTVITNDSTNIAVFDSKKTSVNFASGIPTPYINSCLYGGFGFQRNYRHTNRALFFEITFKYGFSQLHYYGYNNSNNLNITNNSLAFTFGVKI